ncbi:uncharacterized protein LOC125234786 [Leguminivora glycinivorella]|uniref:uncharacterized protein LOC125234786 n=1 Tax=Leguminivora glycinivorella TaxID=1035111 RepID=UPI00200BB501|nr:uncharacterized protein LOC125234786 [Leguminivora glycinivorella]
MLNFAVVVFAILAVSAAVNFDYLDNGIEYDLLRPNMISAVPFPYNEGYMTRGVGNRVANLEPSPTYAAVIEPEEPKSVIVATKLGVVATAFSFAVSCIKKAIFFGFKNLTGLILGSIVALGICKLTPLCDKGHTLLEFQREIRSLATPQRIARATEIVEDAFRKYSAMQ